MGTLKISINGKGLRIANKEIINFGQNKVSYKDLEQTSEQQ